MAYGILRDLLPNLLKKFVYLFTIMFIMKISRGALIIIFSLSYCNVVAQQSKGQSDSLINIGYENKLKMKSIESVSVIDRDQILQTINTDIQQAMQGRASGVHVSSSGQPGGLSSVRIRGLGTLYGGAEPLYVLDGMPISSDYINMINPSDVEKIEVLKDAASCAIYGSRGANGVVLISTKRK